MENIMSQVLIHCQPSLYDDVLTNQLNYEWSRQFGQEELDVIVDNIDALDDEDLCKQYGLDYDQVNCIELV